MKKPSLFIVGHPKSGTTALSKFLGEHPGIFMCDPKEPAFFARDLTAGVRRGAFTERSEEWYLALFADADPAQVAGEASACYLHSKVAAREIAAFAPDAKIIIMLREPVSFLQSLHMQLVKNDPTEAETIRDFEEALAAEPERKQGRRIPRECQVPQILLYSERLRYAEQVGRYLEHFRRTDVKVLVYDDFKRDNAGVYREVLSFIGVNGGFTPAFKTYNKGMMLRSKRLQELARDLTHGTGVGAVLRGPIKSVVPAAVRKRVVGAAYSTIVFREKAELTEEVVGRLKRRYRPEVERISDLLGRDLVREWGYA